MDFPWLSQHFDYFSRAFSLQRLGHAHLFSGVSGVGKSELASWLVRALLCEGAQVPCGQCRQCHLLDADTHPDSFSLSAEDKASIGVDAVRKVTQKVYNTPQLARCRVVVIRDAELMTPAAANALLKTLEEPPGNAFFILLSSAYGQLMPTIVSRCHLHKLLPPEEEDGLRWLNQHGTLVSDRDIMAVCQNAPLAVVRFFEQGLEERFAQFKLGYKAWLKSDEDAILSALEQDTRTLVWFEYLTLKLVKHKQLDFRLTSEINQLLRSISRDLVLIKGINKRLQLGRVLAQLRPLLAQKRSY